MWRILKPIFLCGLCFPILSAINNDKSVSKSSGPPVFFIKDPTDGYCFSGEVFKRCGIDTLWFVTGKAGDFLIHRRPVDETDVDVCLNK